MSQRSVDQREHTERRSVVWLRLHDLFLLRASRLTGSARTCLVVGHPRKHPFPKAPAQKNRCFGPAGIVAQRDERSFGGSRIAFSQRALEPDISRGSNGGRPLRED